MGSGKDNFDLFKAPLGAYISMSFGILLILLGIVFFVRPPEEMPQHLRLPVQLGAITVGVILLAAGMHFVKRPAIVLSFTDEGLWIEKDKVTVPWNVIESVELFSPADRQSTTEKVAAKVVSGNRVPYQFFIITLTKKGKAHFDNKKFIGSLMRNALKIRDEEDFLISADYTQLNKTPLEDQSIYGVVTEIERRVEHQQTKASSISQTGS